MRSLKGFRRLTLEPGETQTVTFALGSDDFALHDSKMRQVVEPGAFTVIAGSSTGGLESRFQVVADTLVPAQRAR